MRILLLLSVLTAMMFLEAPVADAEGTISSILPSGPRSKQQHSDIGTAAGDEAAEEMAREAAREAAAEAAREAAAEAGGAAVP